ncbi:MULTISPECIES: hypothetical protein [unclassified Dietzia]|uniref:hypothetical protein n=1 Tax=unclassified Dietzia TaxID=2617939 RepID=UPI0015F80D22|nr:MULTISPECIES: hypothetical protein [unclassified Dietzia]MBB1041189.1 hypothetical protein [Dietzia sp. Cai40]MBB1042985.1 hypothetical protein [Dietzia sp. DQ11-44]
MIVDRADLPTSVRNHELVATLVAGANARALRIAPCLAEDGRDAARAEAKLILAGAVQRWAQAGSGAIQSATAGPFQMSTDTRQRTGFNLWPSEIGVLQQLCPRTTGHAFTIDTEPTTEHPKQPTG